MKRIETIGAHIVETSPAGQRYLRLPVTFTDQTEVDLTFTPRDLANFTNYLVELNEHLTAEGETGSKEPDDPVVGPITVHGAALAPEDQSPESSILLTLDLSWVRLALRLPPANLFAVGSELGGMMQAAAEPKPRLH